MKTISNKKCFLILLAFILILSSYPTQAAEKSRTVQDKNGMEITIKCAVNSSFISSDFLLNLSIELSKQPADVVKLFEVGMRIRLIDTSSKVHIKKTIGFANLEQNLIRKESTIVRYNSTWGKVRLELKLFFLLIKQILYLI
ncbi:MAG: hypothetical protein HGN29_09970 [Asgard group archaeon]|nr:hypothetical protein [Asgard group archaeon]